MIAPTNYIPLRIINLQGEIYQLVNTENEYPIFQGSWHECAQLLKKTLMEEFQKIISEGILPN